MTRRSGKLTQGAWISSRPRDWLEAHRAVYFWNSSTGTGDPRVTGSRVTVRASVLEEQSSNTSAGGGAPWTHNYYYFFFIHVFPFGGYVDDSCFISFSVNVFDTDNSWLSPPWTLKPGSAYYNNMRQPKIWWVANKRCIQKHLAGCFSRQKLNPFPHSQKCAGIWCDRPRVGAVIRRTVHTLCQPLLSTVC